MELQQAAKDSHRGMWAKGKGTRNVISKFDAVEVFEKLKGKHTPAIVEQVRSGSTLRVYVPSTGHVFPLLLSGVQTPLVKPHVSDEQQAPWARAARFFSELQALHRDVEIVLESLDKSNNFYGSVIVTGSNLGVKLLEAGLARFVDWSATKTANADALKKAEKSAQQSAVRLWAPGGANAVAAAAGPRTSSSAPTAPSKRVEFYGQVVDIINAGTIQVVEFKDGQKGSVLGDEHRINFSSIQAAKLIPREKLKKETDVSKQEIVAAYEARNYLRKKLIGHKVRVVQDYFREANKEHNIPERAFYSVYHEKKNIGLELVAQGFATVSDHKESDARSPDYQDLILAESKAKSRHLGIFAKQGVSMPAFNDLTDRDALQKEAKKEKKAESSAPADASAESTTDAAAAAADANKSARDSLDALQVSRLNQFLPHVQGSRLPAVVERVFSGTRFKVWVDKMQCMLPITLACVRSEKMEATPGSVPPVYPSNRGVGNLAYNTVRSLVYLRDVEILIDSVDRSGAFNALMFVNGKDISHQLVADGLVKLLHAPAKRTKLVAYEDLRKLEDAAKSAHRGVWLNWDEAEEERRIQAIRAKRAEESGLVERKGKTEQFQAQITEIIDCTLFYYRKVDETSQQTFDRITADLQQVASSASIEASDLKEGQLVAAQFASDNTWYRAKIAKQESNDQYLVYYIDYGNSEVVARSAIRALPSGCDVKDLPAQAQEATLAYIKCPSIGEEHGPEAADYLKDLVWDKPVIVSVIHHADNGVAQVALGDPAEQIDVNGELIRAGFARVVRTRFRNPIVSTMREIEDKARASRLGIWQYGDVIDSDEE